MQQPLRLSHAATAFLCESLTAAERNWSAASSVCCTRPVITVYGVFALTFMMAMYALERRDDRFIAAFAVGCALSSTYGFLSGAWPFGVVEAIWSVIAFTRYRTVTAART